MNIIISLIVIIIQTGLLLYEKIPINVSQYYSLLEIIIIFPISVFIGIGFIHLMLILFGGKAEFTETIKFALSISIFPTIIYNIISFILIIIYLNQNYKTSIISAILYLIFGIIIGIIIVIITLKVYSIIHQISKTRVFFAVYLIPFLILLIITIGYQMWFNSYQSELATELEQTLIPALSVQMLTDGKLYIQNHINETIEVSSIKISDNRSKICGGEKQYQITPGTGEYTFDTNSGEGCILEKGSLANILIVTNYRVYTFTKVVK